MSLKNFFFADGIVPFPIPERNEEGKPFEQWDGSTTYWREISSGTSSPNANDSPFQGPSGSSEKYITVYGEGSQLCIKLTARQVTELYWRWAQYKMDFTDFDASDLFNISLSAGSSRLDSFSWESSTKVTSATFLDGAELNRSKIAVANPDDPQKPLILDYGVQNLVLGNNWFTARYAWPVKKGNYGQGSGGGFAVQLVDNYDVFPKDNEGWPKENSYCHARGYYQIGMGVGSLLVSENNLIKTGPDEYWWAPPLGIFVTVNASGDVALRQKQDDESWKEVSRGSAACSKYIITFERDIHKPSTNFSYITATTIPLTVHFSDGSTAKGGHYAFPSESNSSDGSGVSLSISSLKDFLSQMDLQLKPTKFFTYDGTYDETTGLKI